MPPRIEVLGAYSLDVDDQVVESAYELKYGGLQLSAAEAEETRRTVRDELSGVVLIDLLVHDRDGRFDVANFQQVESDQVAYDEAFLTADGTDMLSRGFEVPLTEPLRIAFFLHYYDPERPLSTSYGPVAPPPLEPMPPRLREVVPYEAVD